MNLETALLTALDAHSGQKDKAGQPYILHPLRVMLSLTGETERIVAILHDVVEDSDATLDNLQNQGFSEDVVDAVDALTHRDGESYESYIERLRTTPIARVVKIADLQDNLDESRLSDVRDADRERMTRYRDALDSLQSPK